MMILDATTKSIEVKLGGSVAANQLPVVASYVDVTTTTYTPGSNDTATNNSTAVTAVAAPAASTHRQVKLLTIYNADTASATVTVQLNNNGTLRPLVVVVLAVGSTLIYTDGEGWRVLSSAGAVVTSTLSPMTSAQLAAILSDETGTGAAVFATGPTLVTPSLGTPSAAVLTNATGLPLTTGVSGILPATNGGTGINNGSNNLTVPVTGTAALKSGTPIAGRVASWTDANQVQDAGFAASDTARTDIAETFTDDVTVEGDLTVDLDANITGDVLATGILQAAAAWIPGVAVSLDAKLYCGFNGNEPYETTYTGSSTGHRGQVGTESGGVIYRPGKFGKAVQIAEATTNLVTNPSFENFTPGTPDNFGSWTEIVGAGTIQAFADPIVGTYACRMTWPGSGSITYISQSIAVSSSTTYTLSFDVNLVSGGFYYRIDGNVSGEGGVIAQTLVSTVGRQRIIVSGTTGASDTSVLIVLSRHSGNLDVRFDAVQFEAKAYATPYCDGSLGSGHSWSGTAHASTSSRTAARLTYDSANVSTATGTLALWFWYPYSQNDGVTHYLWSLNNGTQYLDCTKHSNNQLYCGWYTTSEKRIIKSAGTFTLAAGWNHIAIAWSSTTGTSTAYLNGVSIGSTSGLNATPYSFAGYALRIGESNAGTVSNLLFDDLVILSRAASADEIRAIYESNVQLICS